MQIYLLWRREIELREIPVEFSVASFCVENMDRTLSFSLNASVGNVLILSHFCGAR